MTDYGLTLTSISPTPARRAVVIGGGRIGLGVAAHLAHRGGLEVTVLARGRTAYDLTRHAAVRVRLTDGRHVTEEDVPLAVVDLEQSPQAAAAAISRADLVATAVGATRLSSIVPLLASGLRLHQVGHSVDVVAFENHEEAGTLLRTGVERLLGGPVVHGFSGAVVDRVVAHRIPATDTTPVVVVGEPTCHVAVHTDGLTRDWTLLPDVVAVDDFHAWYRRKLHRYSAGHATAAYLGRLKGYRYVHAAVADPEISAAVLAAMEEGRRGLEQRYGSRVAGSHAELRTILGRFGNAALGDTTARVARDVPRKVAREERLVGAARAARDAGVAPTNLALATAAAITSDLVKQPEDATVSEHVAKITGLRPTSELTVMITDSVRRLEGATALLSLHDVVPAWEASSPTRPGALSTRKAS